MGSSPTSYNDNHMDDSSHSHPNDTPSCEPYPPPSQFISLPLSATILLLHHFTVPFPVGVFLHWMNNEYMPITLHKVTSTNTHVHIPDVSNGRVSLIQRCLLQRQQTVHVHQQLGRNNFRTTPWSSQPYRVHTRSLATNRTEKREGIANRNRSS